LLLLLRPNRTKQAWWVLLPLACVAAADAGTQSWLAFLPSQARDLLCEGTEALAFGMAALWLLARQANGRGRLTSFLLMLLLVGAATAATYFVRLDWGSLSAGAELGVLLIAGIFVTTLALSMAGWSSRRSFHPLRLALWLVGWLAVIWTAVTTPFLALFVFFSGGWAPWSQLLLVAWFGVGVSLAAVLPFLILASCNSLFRERLKQLLHLHAPTPPVVIAA
jgi:hypothetical protein